METSQKEPLQEPKLDPIKGRLLHLAVQQGATGYEVHRLPTNPHDVLWEPVSVRLGDGQVEIKISRLICDPKKDSSFKETLKLIKNAYNYKEKQGDMEERMNGVSVWGLMDRKENSFFREKRNESKRLRKRKSRP